MRVDQSLQNCMFLRRNRRLRRPVSRRATATRPGESCFTLAPNLLVQHTANATAKRTAYIRRYEGGSLEAIPEALTEGVTPDGRRERETQRGTRQAWLECGVEAARASAPLAAPI